MHLLAIFVKKTKSAENCNSRVLCYSFMFCEMRTTGKVVAPYIIIYNKHCTSYLLLYSTTIFLSRWWESIPMGIGVIPIPILIDSHSHSHCLFNSCPIPMGFPFPLGFPFPCTSLLYSSRSALTQRSKGQGHTVTKTVMVTQLLMKWLWPVLCNPVLPAAVASVGLHVDTTAYVF